MKRILTISLLVSMLLLAFGCASNTGQQDSIFTKQNIGGVLGGVGGGVLGSTMGHGSGKTAMTIVGALAGAGLGGYIGNQMDENDRYKTNHALETARDNRPVAWSNPNTGRRYETTPTRTYQESDGNYCREYTQKIFIDGREETARGTACRQPDGTWRQVNS